MDHMLIYRLEGQTDQRGYYCSADKGFQSGINYINLDSASPPLGRDTPVDGMCYDDFYFYHPYGESYWRFGFWSLCQLRRWFPADMWKPIKAKCKFVIAVYQVPNNTDCLRKFERQAIFRRETATRIMEFKPVRCKKKRTKTKRSAKPCITV